MKPKKEKQSHTPGPWIVCSKDIVQSLSKGVNIAFCDVDKQSSAEKQANANLIAAAPELLEALKGSMAGHKIETCACFNCKLIKKAEGQS